MASIKPTLPQPTFLLSPKKEPQIRKCVLTPCGMNLQPQRHQGVLDAKDTGPPPRRSCKPSNGTVVMRGPVDQKRPSPDKTLHQSIVHCPADECGFRGLRRVVEQHVRTQHKFHIYDRIKKLSTPEEIAAYREERRKRFPTAANRILKKQALEQRVARGEVLNPSKRKCGTSCISLKPTGLQNAHTETKPENVVEPKKAIASEGSTLPRTTEQSQSMALAKLLESYASASDSDCDEELSTEMKIEETKEDKDLIEIKTALVEQDQDQCNHSISPPVAEDSNDDAPEEIDISHKPLTAPTSSVKHQNIVARGTQNDPFFREHARHFRKPNTLLAKLLESQIRHERNVLLQCVRYVCSTNFLGVLDQSSKCTDTNPSLDH